MIESRTTLRFWKAFSKLPAEIQQNARDSYRVFLDNPSHPGLQFKKLEDQEVYSIRIGLGYRALGVMKANAIVWFWIGNHNDYDQMI